jgi:hypothetical protein
VTRTEPQAGSGNGQRHPAPRHAARSARPARSRCGMTGAELLALPVTVDVATAARALGLGRSTGYELARRGAFPCRVLRVGCSYRVPTADLLRVLGVANEYPPPRTVS